MYRKPCWTNKRSQNSFVSSITKIDCINNQQTTNNKQQTTMDAISNKITAEFDVYYDTYEYQFGDGFYPHLQRKNQMDGRIKVGFGIVNNEWIQTTGPYIDGLDGNSGAEFLEYMNSNFYKPLVAKELQTTTKLCISSMKQNGMTKKVLATPINELSKSEFVYRVLDEMMSCAWEPQAEYIVSLIGNATDMPKTIQGKLSTNQLHTKKTNSYST